MKKTLISISIAIILVAFLLPYARLNNISYYNDEDPANADTEMPVSTTIIVDENGATHYYEFISNNNDNMNSKSKIITLIELATNKYGKIITNKNGKYLTTNNIITTYRYYENTKTTITGNETESKINNEISFETSL